MPSLKVPVPERHKNTVVSDTFIFSHVIVDELEKKYVHNFLYVFKIVPTVDIFLE